MTPTLTATLVLLGTGLASTFFLYRFQLPHERRKAGQALFASIDWGDFFQLVLAVLNARGYERGFGGGSTDGEYLLQRRGQDWLLSSRHSRAYTPGSTVITEFSHHLRGRGIEGGILAIPLRFPRAAYGVGRAHMVELLDGASMWTELQPLLSDTQHEAIDRPARAHLKWKLVVAWLLAIALAVAVFMTLKPASNTDVGAAQSVGAAEAANPEPPVGAPLGRDSPPPPDRVQGALLPIEQRRQSIAEAVANLPHVISASWPAESTLLVVTDSDDFDPKTKICPFLVPDPELAPSRLQIRHPPGSQIPVRFLQCRAY